MNSVHNDLEFSSYHPRHVFRAIVVSQALRYRRIINDDALLDVRLGELKQFFLWSTYPCDMIDEVFDTVRNQPRCLDYNVQQKTESVMTPWIVTYGPCHEELKRKVPTTSWKIHLHGKMKKRRMSLA